MSDKEIAKKSLETLCRIISDAAAARGEVAGMKRAVELVKLMAGHAFVVKQEERGRILRKAAEDLAAAAVRLEQSDLRSKTAQAQLAAAELNRRQGLRQ